MCFVTFPRALTRFSKLSNCGARGVVSIGWFIKYVHSLCPIKRTFVIRYLSLHILYNQVTYFIRPSVNIVFLLELHLCCHLWRLCDRRCVWQWRSWVGNLKENLIKENLISYLNLSIMLRKWNFDSIIQFSSMQ